MSKVLKFALAFSYVLFVSSIVGDTDFRYCEKGAHSVQLLAVDMSPYRSVPGKPTLFTLSAFTSYAISSGKLETEVSYQGRRPGRFETRNLCDEAKCPVAFGDFRIKHSLTLPKNAGPGSYSLKMKILDGNQKELTCVVIYFMTGLRSSVADI